MTSQEYLRDVYSLAYTLWNSDKVSEVNALTTNLGYLFRFLGSPVELQKTPRASATLKELNTALATKKDYPDLDPVASRLLKQFEVIIKERSN